MRYAASIRVRKLTTSRRQPFEPIRYKHPPQIPAESATASPSLSACSPSNSALSALESKFRQNRQCPSLARRSLRLESESRIPAESAMPLTCSISLCTPRFAAESATATGNPIRKCESRQKRQPILPSPHGREAGGEVRPRLALPHLCMLSCEDNPHGDHSNPSPHRRASWPQATQARFQPPAPCSTEGDSRDDAITATILHHQRPQRPAPGPRPARRRNNLQRLGARSRLTYAHEQPRSRRGRAP